jgi:hypothetical protein
MRIFESLHRFLETEEGDVKFLQGTEPKEYRPRIAAITASASTMQEARCKFCGCCIGATLAADRWLMRFAR